MSKLLRMAVPRGPELTLLGHQLRAVGFDVDDFEAPGLHVVPDPFDCGFDFEVFSLAPADVGTYVVHGISHVGVMQTDLIREQEIDAWRPFTFSYARYPIVLAAPSGQSLARLTRKPSLRLASALPRFTARWFALRGIGVEVIPVAGRADTACLLRLTDGFVARLTDPHDLLEHNFRVVEVLGYTRPKLIVNTACGDRRRSAIHALQEALESIQRPEPPEVEIPFED